jgi:hypothetical protein
MAAAATDASATTWSGHCSLSGPTTLTEPSSLVPTQHGYQVRGKGTCQGVLDGETYDGPAELFVDGRMDRPMSCEAGYSTDIPGSLTFPRPTPPVKPQAAAPPSTKTTSASKSSSKSKKKKKKKKKKTKKPPAPPLPPPPPPPPPPKRVDLIVNEANIFTELPLHVSGAYGGTGYVLGTYRNDNDPSTLTACAVGGVSELEGDYELDTVEELYG